MIWDTAFTTCNQNLPPGRVDSFVQTADSCSLILIIYFLLNYYYDFIVHFISEFCGYLNHASLQTIFLVGLTQHISRLMDTNQGLLDAVHRRIVSLGEPQISFP